MPAVHYYSPQNLILKNLEVCGIDTRPWVNPTDLGSHGGIWGGFRGVWNITISGSQTFSFLTGHSSVLKWILLVPLDNMQKKIWFHLQVCLHFVWKSLFDDIFDIIKNISQDFLSQFYKSCFCYCNLAENVLKILGRNIFLLNLA